MMNSVIHPITGKEMQYKDLMKDPDLGPLFEIGLSNELGRICKGIRDISWTNNAFFIDLTSIPKDLQNYIIWQTGLGLQTQHTWKSPGQTDGWWQHTWLQRRHGNVYRGYHHIQDLDQQHIVHTRGKNDDDGHQTILFGYSVAHIRVHAATNINPSTRHNWKNTTWHAWQWTVGSTWKSARECTVWNKQASWQTNCYRKGWNLLVTTWQDIRPAYGCTIQNLRHSV
jgi:hypothetical protein